MFGTRWRYAHDVHKREMMRQGKLKNVEWWSEWSGVSGVDVR